MGIKSCKVTQSKDGATMTKPQQVWVHSFQHRGVFFTECCWNPFTFLTTSQVSAGDREKRRCHNNESKRASADFWRDRLSLMGKKQARMEQRRRRWVGGRGGSMKDSVVLPAQSKVFFFWKKKSLPLCSFVYLSCSFHTNQCCYTTGRLKAPSCQQPLLPQ